MLGRIGRLSLNLSKSQKFSSFRNFSSSSFSQPPLSLSLGHTWRSFATSNEAFLDLEDVKQRVFAVVSNFDKISAAKIKIDQGSKFTEDLGLDSLDCVELVMALEEEFVVEIPDAEAEKLLSVADCINFISSHPQAK